MLKLILSISGKPGLYKLVSQAKNMLVVESLTDGKRIPAYARDKVISLGDIAMFTETGEIPLAEVLQKLKEKESGAQSSLEYKKADNKTLFAYFAEIVPDFDRERVHPGDVKKLISWYNLLVASGNDDFLPKAEDEETAAEEKAE